MATFTVTDTDLDLLASVTFDRWDGPRARYRWTLASISDPSIAASGDDLSLGAFDRDAQDAEALATLLGFFAAFCESVAYERRTGSESDNGNMFAASLRPLADVLDADAVTMLAHGLYDENRLPILNRTH